MEVLKLTEEKQGKDVLQEKPMSFMTHVLITGLFAGIFWSFIGFVSYIFNLTSIHPRVIIEPWTIGEWKKEWLGTVIAIILLGVLSTGAALIYYVALRKFKSMWIGILYGLVLFGLVFLILNPIFPGIPPFNKLGLNTLITCLCLYALYGLFVGYTISYEESEQQKMKGYNDKEVSPS
jgi:hypothetical protein